MCPALMSLHLLQGNGSERQNRMDVTGVKLCSLQLTFLSSILHRIVSLINETNAAHNPDRHLSFGISHKNNILKTDTGNILLHEC